MAEITTRSDGKTPRKNRPRRATGRGPYDPETERTFLEELARTGLKYHSARAAGSCYRSFELRKKVDSEFADRYEDALLAYKESLLQEAHRRAVDGWEEPVFSQKKGGIIGHVRKFSDSILLSLLRARIPEEFRENVSLDANVKGGGGVLLVPGMKSEEEWEQAFAEANRERGDGDGE